MSGLWAANSETHLEVCFFWHQSMHTPYPNDIWIMFSSAELCDFSSMALRKIYDEISVYACDEWKNCCIFTVNIKVVIIGWLLARGWCLKMNTEIKAAVISNYELLLSWFTEAKKQWRKETCRWKHERILVADPTVMLRSQQTCIYCMNFIWECSIKYQL